VLPRPRWVLETRLRTLAPTVSEIGLPSRSRQAKVGALGGNRTRVSALATRRSAIEPRTHLENCRAGTQCRHMRHSTAYSVFLPGTQQRTNTFTPAHCRRGHGIFTVDVSVFRAHLPRSPSIVIGAWESFDQGRTVRRVGRQSLDTPALGRLTFCKVAPQRPLKSPVVVTDSRRVASYSWWRGLLFASNFHLRLVFLSLTAIRTTKNPAFHFGSRVG
jgi:hypothetical protein